MLHHLALINSSQSGLKSSYGASPRLSDMDVIGTQAKLMEAGSISFRAMKSGEIADILVGVVALAYASLQALPSTDCNLDDYTGENHTSYQLRDIMQQLSNKINACSSGEAEHYIALYYACSHLATDFLNADFDKAFRHYHEWRIDCLEPSKQNNFNQYTLDNLKLPDLTDCLYE